MGEPREYLLRKPDSKMECSETKRPLQNLVKQEETGTRKSDRGPRKGRFLKIFSRARRKLETEVMAAPAELNPIRS
jgi:hypothetical protein